MAVERKLLLVDLRNTRDRERAKACPTCGAETSRPIEAALGDDEHVKARRALQKLTHEGWELDLGHVDTARFADTAARLATADDNVFVVALRRVQS